MSPRSNHFVPRAGSAFPRRRVALLLFAGAIAVSPVIVAVARKSPGSDATAQRATTSFIPSSPTIPARETRLATAREVPTVSSRLAALLAANALAEPAERTRRLHEVMADWAAASPDTLLPALFVHGDSALLRLAVVALTQRDPDGARENLAAVFGETIPAPLLEAHYFEWPTAAAVALRARVDALPAGTEKDTACLAAVVPWARNDPAAAFAWFQGHARSAVTHSSLIVDEILRATLLPLARQDPAGALAVLTDLRVAGARAENEVWHLAARTALRRHVDNGGNPIEALQWANQFIGDAAAWDAALLDILGTALRRRPEMGRQLLGKINDADLAAALRSAPAP